MPWLESEYKRQKTLFSENISSEKLFLEAESNYKKALAISEGLKQQLLLLHIDMNKIREGIITPSATLYAPIAGDIIRINADISRFIQPSDIVVEIVDTHQLQIYLSVFEKDIFSVRQGQTVLFSLPGSSVQRFSATVKHIGKAVDRTDRTVTVQAIPSSDKRDMLLPGMYIDAGIVVDTKTVYSLPMDALIKEESNYYVLLLQSSNNSEYLFRKVQIQTGKRSGDLMEIIPDETVSRSSIILVEGVYQVK